MKKEQVFIYKEKHMKVSIIVFSPSGNTAGVAESLKGHLTAGGAEARIVDVAAYPEILLRKDYTSLNDMLGEYDVLCVGGPVYAHHLQYHAADLIGALPPPADGRGRLAFPFVTYGGICSGIALEEAAALLKATGRTVVGGLKVAAPHRMTTVFMGKALNGDQPDDAGRAAIEAAARTMSAGTMHRSGSS